MSVANNDFNWRVVAAEAIEENRVVTLNGAGKAVKGGDKPVGIVPQPVASGQRAPVIRGGRIGGLSGFSAGDRLRGQEDGSLGKAGENPVVAVVSSEDASVAYILSGNLDSEIE